MGAEPNAFKMGERPLRVFHIDTGEELRGGQHQLLLLARYLRQRGHEQLLVSPAGSPLEASARIDGFDVFALSTHDLGYLHGSLQLRQEVQGRQPHILHAHDGRAQTLAWLASRGLSPRRIASRRVAFLPRRGFLHRLQYGWLAHGVVAVSNSVRQVLVQTGVPAERIEVIGDGVELPPAPAGGQLRREARARWGLTEDDFVVGMLGASAPEKGYEVALKAAALLAGRMPRLRLVLAGMAPADVAGEVARPAAALAGRVLVPGCIANPAEEFFPALDVYIMPSRIEGLGSSALMAMAHGLPVIASRVGGLPEVVEEGVTGWLVPPGSAEALADAIARAAADPVGLRAYAARAWNHAQAFSIALQAERTEAFYYRILGPMRR